MKLPELNTAPDSQLDRLRRRLEHYPEITRKELHRLGMDCARIRELRGKIKPYYKIECSRCSYDPDDRLYSVIEVRG
jgi:hypothetical protein